MDGVTEHNDLMSQERSSHVGRIVHQAGQRLKAFIRARVASHADADDILQDVWQQLIRTLEDGPIEHVGAWLYTVARNRIIDQYRKPRMTSLDAPGDEMEPGDEAFELADFLRRDDATPESEHLRNMFWEQLRAALAELPPEQRQVFVWHELEGLSFQEIAKLTGENLNTLLSRKRYAVRYLRQRLRALHDDFLP
jgi:RNA polymerase sigma factor (sigma-70 family)